MFDKNSSPCLSRANESFAEVNWLSLWEACGNDWRWMIKANPNATKRSISIKRLIHAEVLLTATLLVAAIALSFPKTSAVNDGKLSVLQESNFGQEIVNTVSFALTHK